ncbi:MAG TPA: amylo-alpha-1,6-glucosidase [Nostocaceae cyanobacterium]|nr:amylo-alpha-1,6-glucosidase [Nostocaceae cyanobacterium]
MIVDFGREICGNLETAATREWLVTNGMGSYASGTVAGMVTRCYHGLLVAALNPPLSQTLLLTKLDETAHYDNQIYPLFANCWANGFVEPQGYKYIESFHLEGTIPVWDYAFGDAILQKRIWMQPEANTTYIYYQLKRGNKPVNLSIKAFVNYRNYHSRTHAGSWRMNIDAVENGVCITAFPGAIPFYLLTDKNQFSIINEWCYNFELAAEKERGLEELEDNLLAVIFEATIQPGNSLTFVASTETRPDLHGEIALNQRYNYEQNLLNQWRLNLPAKVGAIPEWINQLVLAADQFIVNRPVAGNPDGKTIIAGYHWFSDWGRDTMISLPGLTLSTGRPEVANLILRTFAKYVSQGMLPNVFPYENQQLVDDNYNTVDATLWYFEAIRLYYNQTGDDNFLNEIFPILADIIDWHKRGTRFNIHLDEDGLIYAGYSGVQLTWMDAKVGEWVVTPRTGKPVEINALWYNALRSMSQFAQSLQKPYQDYEKMAEATLRGFARFWNSSKGYCFDVIDTPVGNDDALRPNQIFAVSLPHSPLNGEQQRNIVDVCNRYLLTSHGLRSLAPDHPEYQGIYTGNQVKRDGAYHQGTVWGWLLGSFVLAHLRVYQNPEVARQFLAPMKHHLTDAGLGSISEIFNGDAPMQPKGCIAQAWSVGEVLRAWLATFE